MQAVCIARRTKKTKKLPLATNEEIEDVINDDKISLLQSNYSLVTSSTRLYKERMRWHLGLTTNIPSSRQPNMFIENFLSSNSAKDEILWELHSELVYSIRLPNSRRYVHLLVNIKMIMNVSYDDSLGTPNATIDMGSFSNVKQQLLDVMMITIKSISTNCLILNDDFLVYERLYHIVSLLHEGVNIFLDSQPRPRGYLCDPLSCSKAAIKEEDREEWMVHQLGSLTKSRDVNYDLPYSSAYACSRRFNRSHMESSAGAVCDQIHRIIHGSSSLALAS
jgi:hypothetical protein